MNVRQLTTEQKNSLIGVEYAPNMQFNPIQDKNGKWIISNDEASISPLQWVKDLPSINFEPKAEVSIKP